MPAAAAHNILGKAGGFDKDMEKTRNKMLNIENAVNTVVFKGFPVSGKVGICDNLGGFGTSFWEVLGCLGEHFGGLGGSWRQVEI